MDNTIRCEACGKDFPETAPYLSGPDCALCEDCAPTYQSLLDEPEGFVGADEEPLTPEAARAWVERHLSMGGKVTDTIINMNKREAQNNG